MKVLKQLMIWLLVFQLSGVPILVAQPVLIQPRDPFRNNTVGNGVQNLRVGELKEERTSAEIRMDYTYDGLAGPTATIIPVLGKRGQKGVSAWFGTDGVTIGRGRGTVTVEVKYFNDEAGVPAEFTTDQVQVLILNSSRTAILGAVPFLKTIRWGDPNARSQPEAATPALALQNPEELRQVAEEKERAEKKARAEVEAREKARIKLEAEAQARKAAEEKARDEALARQEARKKADEEAARLAEARRLAEAKAAAEARAEEEARQEAEKEAARRLEARRIAEENAAAEAKARRAARERALAEEQARKEAEAKLLAEAREREQARLRAEAEAKRIEEEARAAEAKLNAEKEERAEALARAKAREKAEAEARRLALEKKMAEEKARAEALAREQARQRAEAEERARREAEQKAIAEAKAREDARLRAEAEAKRIEQERQIAEAKRLAEEKEREKALLRAEMEAKRLAEEERRAEAKAAAEAKARKEAEEKAFQEALAQAKAEAEAKKLADGKVDAQTRAKSSGRTPSEAVSMQLAEGMKTRITNVDVVNRSMDRSEMTFGVEFEYRDRMSGPMLGVDVLRGNDPSVSRYFVSAPAEIGKSRRNFVLFPVKFQPPTGAVDSSGFSTDKVLVYLMERATSKRFNIFPATMLLRWHPPGGQAAMAQQSGDSVEIEDFKQNDESNGYVSIRYHLTRPSGQLRVKVYDSANPESAEYFASNRRMINAGQGLQLIDVKVEAESASPTDLIRANTVEVELLDADNRVLKRVSRQAQMLWAKPKEE